MKKSLFLIATIITSTISKETVNEITINFDMPEYVKNTPSKKASLNNENPGSLYGKGESVIFGDRKASKVNDILMVRIAEQASISSTGNKKIQSKSDVNLANPTLGKDYDSVELSKDYSIKQNGTSSQDGQGSSSRNESISATIATRIVKVLENNNYFIAGSKELLIDGEKSYIKISGVVRAEDIDTSNTIASNMIADAKIMYSTEGEITNATHEGWGNKIVNSVWPF